MIRVTENALEPQPQKKQRGLFNYLFDNQCDIIVSGVPVTHERSRVVDLTFPWTYGCYALLIPAQEQIANIFATIKPFQWPVWLGLFISIICVIISLNILHQQDQLEHPLAERRAGDYYLYVLGILMSQGNACTSNRFVVRVVAGVWTLAAFVFVQAYTSTLFTYVMAPNNPPLINSVYDVIESSDINLLYRTGSTLNVLVSDPDATGIVLKIRNKVIASNSPRCNLISECIAMITPGSRNVFANARSFQVDAVRENFEKTGKCGIELARDCFLVGPAALVLQKHSPYTDAISMGLLHLRESGILEHWLSWFSWMPRQCERQATNGQVKRKKARSLSLKNLTSAFIALLIGFGFSLFAFVCEVLTGIRHRRQSQTSLASVPNVLKGKHLRIIWPRWEGNPKGLSGPLKGGVIIDYLSARLGFTYEMVRITENRLEPAPNQRGLFNYLWDGKCDFLVSSVSTTWERNKIFDFTTPWDYGCLTFLIPVHSETANIKSVVKPFQWPVWVGLVVTVVCVIVVLTLIQRYLLYTEHRSGTESATNMPGNSLSKGQTGRQYVYVFGNLLSQGGPCTSDRISFRFVAGVWTLAAFIFVQAYTSTLFTYVVAPVNQPLINSIYDIAENPDINLLVKKAGTADTMFTNNNWTGFYEKIRDRINSMEDSRCVLISDCIKLVTPGSKNVFIDGYAYQLDAIKEDFKNTGKCNLQLARDTYTCLLVAMVLPKHSPYTDPINKGILELREGGFFDYWDLWFRPMPGQCMENIKNSGFKPPKGRKHPPLSLKNLSGAFLLFLMTAEESFGCDVRSWHSGYRHSLSSLASMPNPLKGQHIRIIWPRWEGNPKGLSGPLKGGVIIDYLAARLGFTYEMVRITENRLEPAPKQRGLFDYLWDGKCDFLVTAVVPTWERNKVVDLTMPWDYTTLSLLIPVHRDIANIKSVVKPFQWPVWVGLIVTAICVVVVLNLIQRYLEYMEHRSSSETAMEPFPNLTRNNSRLNGRAGKQYLYVLGNLLSQGGPCVCNRLSFRLVAGVWTLAAFIFVQAYTSILFTYVVAPVNLPLINSIYDIADSDDINLLMKKAGTPEGILMNNNWTGIYEKIRNRVNSFPDSRCVLVSDCIKFILPGSRNVFIDGAPYQLDAIKQDFEKTGKCNLQLARDSYSTLPIAMALPKHSPYTNPISKGFLELQERGLVNYWDLWFRPMPVQCTENFKPSRLQSSRTQKHPPLSLKNLTGAFLVLLVGISLAFLAFLCEQIISMPGRQRPCRRI
ncbi:hypothetical protein GHT06_011005 [Daphnia sinensis]|uniref:Ionotropic glutamate receptor C-terminal domain-containing protein n=1 Tax=Daphnia sinensis TaxID=1820382 RepID=A0AAD5L1Z8_9CRUS|nr:hypothetical protein GHT06_011005 [Daphnia sinensis]